MARPFEATGRYWPYTLTAVTSLVRIGVEAAAQAVPAEAALVMLWWMSVRTASTDSAAGLGPAIIFGIQPCSSVARGTSTPTAPSRAQAATRSAENAPSTTHAPATDAFGHAIRPLWTLG